MLLELTVIHGRFDYGRRGYVWLSGMLDVTMIEFQLAVVSLLSSLLEGFALSVLLETSTVLI